MKLIERNLNLVIEQESLLDALAINSLLKRTTTYRDVKIRGRMSTVEDKRFYLHNKRDNNYTFHINQKEEILQFFKENDIKVNITKEDVVIKRKPTRIKVRDGFNYRDDTQRRYAEFLAEDRRAALCTIETGGGKTGSTIMFLLKEKNPGKLLIFTAPRYYYIWEEAVVKFTDVKKENVYITSGRESLLQLMNDNDNVEVILLSPSTWRDYLKSYYSLDSNDTIKPDEFLHKVGIDTVVIDEAHDDFGGNFLGVLGLNPSRYIALTATYSSRYDSAKISKFKRYFIPDKDRLPIAEFKKFINVIFCQYRLENPNNVKYLNAMDFYSHSLYEDSLCKSRTRMYKYFDMLLSFVHDYYDNKHRLLVLFATKNMCREFHYYVKKNKIFGSKKVATKLEGDAADVAYKAHVIISTDKSSGTGVDIENLQCTLNTIAIRSDNSSMQFKGRNREMDNVEQYYLSVSCTNIPQHVIYKKSNIVDFTNKSKAIMTNYYSANV